jgi:hypothetical protein
MGVEMIEELDKYLGELEGDRGDRVRKMFGDNEVRVKECPASTKYHGSREGGLLEHVVEVVKMGLVINEQMGGVCRVDSVKFCCLVHDMGKLGSLEESMYVRVERGGVDVYEHNDKLVAMPHELRTLYWLSRYGVEYDEEEMQAIFYHAGAYMVGFMEYVRKESKLVNIVHVADNLVTKVYGK